MYNGFSKHLNTVPMDLFIMVIPMYYHDKQVNTNQEVDTLWHFEVEFSSDQPTTSASMLQVSPVITQNSLNRMYGSVVAHKLLVILKALCKQ